MYYFCFNGFKICYFVRGIGGVICIDFLYRCGSSDDICGCGCYVLMGFYF